MPKIWDPNAIRLLNLGPTAAWRTQAVYQATAEMMTADSPDTLIICQPLSPYVCLGREQTIEAVLDRAACQNLGLTVVQRPLDGGALYLDANQLLFQGVFHHSRAPETAEAFDRWALSGPLGTLGRLGLKARLGGPGELVVDGRRIAVVSSGRIAGAAVFAGTLLFNFDYRVLPQVWRVPDPAFRELASNALREKITTIWREDGPVTIEQALWMMLDEYATAWGRPIVRGTPKQAETRHSREVAKRLVTSAEAEGEPVPPMMSLKIGGGVRIEAKEVEQDGRKICLVSRVHDNMA